MTDNSKARPLSGMRVVDTTDEVGELCGRMLADLGAEVVRVEPPGGARSRRLPPYADDGSSLWFGFRNAGKRSVVIDLDSATGAERFDLLLAGSDVWLESSTPGTVTGTALDPDAVVAAHPHLIVASMTPFGQTGPYAGYAATDDVLFALGGHLSMSGIPSKPPLLMPGSLASDAAAIMGVIGVLAARVDQGGSNQGVRLDISALEALTQMNTWGLPNTSAIVNAGMTPQLLRNGTGPMYPNFATKDGFVRMVILAPGQWRAMWEWMGSPEAFSDPAWGQTVTRMQNLDILNPMFAELFATMTMEEAAEEGQRRGAVVTPMLKPADVLHNVHYRSRDTFTDLELLPGVTGKVATGFMTFDRERCGPTAGTPALAADTETVLAELPEAKGEPDAAPAPHLPLEGVRVLDFGHGGVGVEGGRMLAEYGADVIKIETRTYPDFMRLITGSEMTPSFASSSRTKRSFGVNVKNPEGRAVLLELVKTADIVIENNSTGTMDAMGVGYDTLREANPDIVMVSSQLMGAFGEYAAWTGYGPTIQTVGGLNHLWNFADGDPPPGSNAIHPDHLAGRLCAIGGLAGMLGRDGGGTHCEISQAEALVNTLGDLFFQESVEPGSVQPLGNDSELGAPWGVFPCTGDEQYVVICVRDDDDWEGLRRAMGDPEWARADRLASAAGRLTGRDELNDAVAEWTATLESRNAMERCQAEGVPAGAMLTSADQMTDPHLLARGFIANVDQQDAGPLVLEGPAMYGDRWSAPVIRQAPRLGEHTRSICVDDLGMDAADVERLIEAGALEVTKEG
ncbi:MAG: CoA transferase [Acidimicrobiales bacterium]|nr:CoA transferase [Acidimicrobiales bacterium]